MMKDGWKGNICNVDFSSIIIKQMKQWYNDSLYQKIQCIQSRRNEKKTSSEEFPRLVSDDDNNNGEASGVGKRGNLKRFKKKVDDILNKIADISACYVGLLLVFIFCTYCIITRAPAVCQWTSNKIKKNVNLLQVVGMCLNVFKLKYFV
jgi:hypothetical protein